MKGKRKNEREIHALDLKSQPAFFLFFNLLRAFRKKAIARIQFLDIRNLSDLNSMLRSTIH